MIILLIVLYICMPVIMTPLIIYLFLKTDKYNKIYLFLMSMTLGIFGYNFIPRYEYDLTRHFEKISVITNLDFFKVWNYNGTNPLFIENLSFYFIGKLGDYQILPLIGVVCTYYFAFLVIYEFFKMKNVKKSYAFLAIVFVAAWYPILSAMSGVRFTSALSMSAYAIFLLYFKNKSIGFIYLFLLSFWHMGMFLFVILVVVLKLFRFKAILILILIAPAILEIIIVFFDWIPIAYFSTVAEKIRAYQAYKVTMRIDQIYLYIKFFVTSSTLIYLLFFWKKVEFYLPKKFIELIISIIVLCLVFFNIPSLMERYSYVILIFLPLIIINLIIKFEKNLKFLFFQLTLFLIVAGALLQNRFLIDSLFYRTFSESVFFTYLILL